MLPNGQVVSGATDNTLRVWDVRTTQCLEPLAHAYPVTYLAVLPNGQVVGCGGSREQNNTFKSWTIAPRHCYEMIAPVLQAITPECGLQKLSLRGVYLGPVGYESLRELVQNVSFLRTLGLRNTDLEPVQINTLQQIMNQHQTQEEQRKAQIQAARDQLLQKQAERIGQLEIQLQTILQAEHNIQAQYQQQQAQAKRLQELEIQMQRLQAQYAQ